MSLLLLELAQNYFLGSTGRQTSLALGESEPSIRTSLQSVVPLVLGALLVQAQRPGGAAELAMQAQQVYGHGLLSNLSELLASLPQNAAAEESPLASQRTSMLRSLLGSDYLTIVAGLNQQVELRPASVGNLLTVVVAVLLGLLGRHAAQHQLGAAELASYLANQRDAIRHAVNELPRDVSGTLPDLLDGPLHITAKMVLKASSPLEHPAVATTLMEAPSLELTAASPSVAPPLVTCAGEVMENYLTDSSRVATPFHQKEAPSPTPINAVSPIAPERVSSRPELAGSERRAGRPTTRPARRWPWLVGALVLTGLGYIEWAHLMPTSTAPPAVGASATSAPVTPMAHVGQPATGQYEVASDTYHYDPGSNVLVSLSTGNQLHVGSQSAEAQLFYVLTGSSQARPDSAQAGILLDQVGFTTGTATLTVASQRQLSNLVSLLQAFPRARLKIGCFTDNQGSAEANLLQSADRANVVRNALLARGITPNRVAAQGYGQTHFLVSNSTREGRAQNRRVAILLTNK